MAPQRTAYRSRNARRQTRLQFSSLPASSPDKNDYSPAVHDRLSRVTYTGSTTSSRKTRRNADKSATPEASSQPLQATNAEDSSPRSDPPSTPPTSSVPPPSFDDDGDDELQTPASKRRRLRRNEPEQTNLSTPLRRSARIGISSPPLLRSTSSRSSRFSHAENAKASPSPQATSEIGEAESTDDEAAVLAFVPTQRKRAKPSTRQAHPESRGRTRPSHASGRILDEVDWMVNDDEVEYISSDGGSPQPRPRERKTASRSARKKSRKEREEIEADLEDLQDSGVEDESSKTRTRGGPVTTQRDLAREHLDLLKRRRAGERIPRVYDSDDEQSVEGQDISYIGQPADDLSDQGSVHSSAETEPEENEAPTADDNVDDFIEDDEEAEIGVSRRPRSDVPLEFTSWMSAKPRELFPHIIEWLVKNKIAPAFPRDDDIFKLAFQRINDQVAAQAGSRLISSAWNAQFKDTILARPQIAIGMMPGMDEDHIRTCDACNKTNRPAKFDFVISGNAYNMNTLEPIEKDSDAEDDGADDLSVDYKGHILALQDRHFYLGSHCAANAQMGHKLMHWKYHLNETVLDYLQEQGVLSAAAIVSRDKKNKRKREKEAEAIVDSMEEIGKIDELWAHFQRDLKDAMLGMEDYTVRGGRSQGRIGVVRTRTTDGRTREWNNHKYSERITLSDSE